MPPSDAVAAENASRRWRAAGLDAVAADNAPRRWHALEATDLHVLVTHLRVAAPRVALEVRAQTNNVVEPEGGDV